MDLDEIVPGTAAGSDLADVLIVDSDIAVAHRGVLGSSHWVVVGDGGHEELLAGVLGVLLCFAVLGLGALGIAARAKTPFGRLTAVGASLMLWLQGMLNAGVAMGVLPTKGTTLPLVSYGGTSLVASLAAFGLVLNVARATRPGRKGWR